MNEAESDAIRQRLNAASRGPWQAEGAEVRAADGDLVADTLYEDRTYDDNNVEFIAHAPEDVAALLAEVDRLRTQLAEQDRLVRPVIRAWVVPGRAPAVHERWQERLLNEWPTLGRALVQLTRTAPPPVVGL